MSLVVFWYSNAHCCLAPSICRRLFIHPFEAGVVRARMNAGRTKATLMITNITIAAAMIDFLDIFMVTPDNQEGDDVFRRISVNMLSTGP